MEAARRADRCSSARTSRPTRSTTTRWPPSSCARWPSAPPSAGCGSPTRRWPGAATSTSTTTPGGSSRPADHPALGTCLDSFHILSRGTDLGAIADIPGEKLFYLQLADAPHLEMDVLQWSRHYRCFPGQGALRPRRLRRAACSPPATTARCRSRSSTTSSARPTPTARRSTPCARCSCSRTLGLPPAQPARCDGFAFVELGVDADSAPETEALLRALGFAHVGPHRSKPVQLWQHGDIRIVLNHGAGDDDPEVVARRRRERRPRALRRARRGAARAGARAPPQPGRGRPVRGRRARRHRRVFFCGAATGGWLDDFLALEPEPANGAAGADPRIDHITLAQPFEAFDEAGAVLPLACSTCGPGASAELAAPDGLVRSRAVAERRRPRADRAQRAGAGRHPARAGRAPARRVRLRRRARGRARDARARRADPARSPTTTTTTSAARLELDPDAARRAARARRPLRPQRRRRAPALLHGALGGRVFFEVLERRGGYDGYGAVNSPVRMAAQRTATEEERMRAARRSSNAERGHGPVRRARRRRSASFPRPPPLRRLIGPSVILIGVGIASGEYILYPFIASQAGLVFLWAAVVGILVQFFINMEIERYTLATGETAIGGFMRHVEAVGRRSSRCGAILATDVAGLGDGGRDDRDVRVRRRRPERDRDRRPARHRRHADRLAGRLPDRREARVHQDRRGPGVPRGRAVRGDQRDRVQRTRRRSSRASARSRARSRSRSSSARSRPPAPAARTTSCRATGSATRASAWAATCRASSPRSPARRRRRPTSERFSFPQDEANLAPLAGLVEAREPRAVRLVRADRRDRDHRLLAGRLLDGLRATPTCPTRAASTSSRSRPSVLDDTVGQWFGTLFLAVGAVSLFAAALGIVDYVVAPGRRRRPRRLHARQRGAGPRAGCTSRSSGRWSRSAARSCCSASTSRSCW